MKKKVVIFALTLFTSLHLFSQDYKKVDSIVSTYPEKFYFSTKLANRISSDFQNNFEKVRAVYSWIANNIDYDSRQSARFMYSHSSNEEFVKKEEKRNKNLSKSALVNGRAVCEGFSALFSEICTELKIKSKIIEGKGKNGIKDIGAKYVIDHSWNIVLIDDKEYLIDVTWGAGSYYPKKYFYFLTEPGLFIKNHYPNDYQNSLLKRKIEKSEFMNSPMVYDYNFELLSPKNGIISGEQTEKVKFKFSTKKMIYSISYGKGQNKYSKIEDFKHDGEILEFEIDMTQIEKKELILYSRNERIIGFKIK